METTWLMEFSTDPTFTNESDTSIYDFSDNGTFDGTWDLANLSYTLDNDFKSYWIYWKLELSKTMRLPEMV